MQVIEIEVSFKLSEKEEKEIERRFVGWSWIMAWFQFIITRNTGYYEAPIYYLSIYSTDSVFITGDS